MSDDSYEGWAVVELMGHRKLAGKVSEATVFGKSMLRLDVFAQGQHVATQYYNPDSIYCVTPSTEDICLQLSELYRPAPVQRYELPSP